MHNLVLLILIAFLNEVTSNTLIQRLSNGYTSGKLYDNLIQMENDDEDEYMDLNYNHDYMQTYNDLTQQMLAYYYNNPFQLQQESGTPGSLAVMQSQQTIQKQLGKISAQQLALQAKQGNLGKPGRMGYKYLGPFGPKLGTREGLIPTMMRHMDQMAANMHAVANHLHRINSGNVHGFGPVPLNKKERKILAPTLTAYMKGKPIPGTRTGASASANIPGVGSVKASSARRYFSDDMMEAKKGNKRDSKHRMKDMSDGFENDIPYNYYHLPDPNEWSTKSYQQYYYDEPMYRDFVTHLNRAAITYLPQYGGV